MPAIAIVDSGIDKNLPDFAGRNIKQVNFVGSGKPNGALDGRGHGSFVAGIAAGSGEGLRRRGSECTAHLARRHGRLRFRPDE